ncbi:MAG: T9SS type A sorting domain-containing protein [Ignavibacteriaceae bacterium]
MKLFTSLIFIVTLFLSFYFYQSQDQVQNFKEIELDKYQKGQPGPDQRPYEWAYLQRVFPYMGSDPDAYMDALNEAHQLQRKTKAKRLSKGESIAQWDFAGPNNVGGRVVDLEINPANPNIIYAAFATGGVFKSTDMGGSWFSVFDSLNVLTIGDIGIDPSNPDIIYVGTGEANGGHNNFPGGGVFKSTNAGLTWEHKGLVNTTSIGRIIVHPTDPNIVYLAAVGSYFTPNPERGIYKSTDAGESWSQSLFISDSTGAIDIVMDPTNPDFLLAAMWERVRRPNSSHLYGPSSGIYRSTDGGDNWELLADSTGLPNSNTQNIGRIGLAMSQSNPSITYALYNDGSFIIGLYKTTDYGDNWMSVDTDNELTGGASNFSWYFGQVRVHPTNPDTVYVLDVGFMRSTDGGNSWSISFQTHVDHHALTFNPDNPDWVIEGNDGGIYISTNTGQSWGPKASIPATQFYEIGLDAINPDRLYGGTQDNGTNRISSLNGINGGEPTNWSTPVVMDPNDNNVLYYGTDRIYRTTNAAGNWIVVSGDLSDGIPGTRLGTVTTIAVAPSNSDVIYAGTDDSHVWVTSDYGSTWIDISASLPYRWVTRVVVDPVDENIVYVTFSGLKWRDPQPHVFRSSNMGTTWENISSNLPDAPVNAFAVDNNDQSVLYLGSDVGMYVSYNTGASWEFLGQGIPVVTIGDIKIHPTSNYLVAGTHGRSMYKLNLNDITSVEQSDDDIAVSDFVLEQNYPNPFNPSTKIKYTIPPQQNPLQGGDYRGGLITLKVYDILGNEIATLVNEEKTAGSYEVSYDANTLSSGIYFYTLNAGSFIETKKMVLLR